MEVVETHKTVLLEEALGALALTPESVVVDATGGGGGHSARILQMLNSHGTLVVFESDPSMVAKLRVRLGTPSAHLHILQKNFRTIRESLAELGIEKVDAVLADLGWNSEQFEGGGKGFSFKKEEPLLMTYGDPTDVLTARDIVNDWSEDALADALYAYADERYARRIAKGIVAVREKKPIETTRDLVACIEEAVPALYRRGRIHPATKTFQALRIAVNDELDALKDLIEGATAVLKPKGRLAVITFHSIEDRLVKQMFRDMQTEGRGNIITKKPIVAGAEELHHNPRARSAKLRILHLL